METLSIKKLHAPSKSRMGSLIFSHHPLCDNYNEHVITIRGRKYCKGCMFTYPAMAIALLSGIFISVVQDFSYFEFLILALIGLSISLFRLLPINSKTLSIFFRINLGLSLGFGWLSILFAPGIIHSVLIFSMFAMIHGIIVFYKWGKFLKPCEKCEDYPNFPKCTGFNIKSTSDHRILP